MSKPSARRWSRVGELFDRLSELPAGERSAALAATRAGPETRRQLQRLLGTLDELADFPDPTPELTDPPTVSTEGDDTGLLKAGDRIGDFEVLRLLGRGSVGETYLARRAEVDFVQHVALKLLRPEAVGPIAHFDKERRILAAIDHPGVARLIDGGLTPAGQQFLVTEYVEGRDILAWTQVHAPDLEGRLRLFCELCGAVDFAHRNLVVHRNIKPANILVTTDGRAKLLDFGIARLVADNGTPAQVQALLTPDYAAPEQLDGGAITMATDVYALGLLLYELLTGATPWHLRPLPLTSHLSRRLTAEPVAPSVAARDRGPVPARRLKGDLDAIVLKALRREPARRYQSAARLRNDVERHLLGDTVQARGDSRGYRLRRFLGRNRLAVGASATLLGVLVGGLASLSWQARVLIGERDQARAESAHAQAVRDSLMQMYRSAGENVGADALSATQVLDDSARRLDDQFRDDPRTRAALQETLGSLYAYMHNYEGAAPLLRSYLESAEARARPDARATITAQLAEVELRRGDIAEARRLLDKARAHWNRDPVRHRQALVDSRPLLALVEGAESGLPQSILSLQASLQEHDEHYGREHSATASLLTRLGIAHLANQDLEAAETALRDAWTVHEALGKARSAGALATLGPWATVAIRKDDMDAAEDRLRRAIDLRRALYGPSAVLASLQAELGKVLLRGDRSSEALPLLQEALALSREFTGAQSAQTIALLQSLTEAHIARRELELAASTLTEARDAARAHSGENQVLYALCDGLQARLHLARHEPRAAQVLADLMASKLGSLGEAGAPHRPEVDRLYSDIAASAP